MHYNLLLTHFQLVSFYQTQLKANPGLTGYLINCKFILQVNLQVKLTLKTPARSYERQLLLYNSLYLYNNVHYITNTVERQLLEDNSNYKCYNQSLSNNNFFT